MIPFTLRPFTGTDFDTYCAVWNAVWPDHSNTSEEMRHEDAMRDSKLIYGRMIAEDGGGNCIGCGYYGQNAGMYHPQRFHLELTVLPEYERQGIGTALYEAILQTIAPRDPLWLRAEVREDRAAALRFVQSRGFTEDMREQESKLTLSGFDPSAFSQDLARVHDERIEIASYADLKARDPQFFEKLFEIWWELHQDIPSPEAQTRPDFAVWRKRFDNPHFLWDGCFAALDGNRYVGISTLYGPPGKKDIYTGITGVSRDYRKRGIASALKVCALTFAKEYTVASVRTWNEVGNAGMLGINERLGFVRQPVWISFVKNLVASEGKTV